MNNRSRNKDKAIKRYCSKIKMGLRFYMFPMTQFGSEFNLKMKQAELGQLLHLSGIMEVK